MAVRGALIVGLDTAIPRTKKDSQMVSQMMISVKRCFSARKTMEDYSNAAALAESEFSKEKDSIKQGRIHGRRCSVKA